MAVQTSSNSSAPDVLDTLNEDHKKIIDLFDEFQNIKERADDETRQTLVEVACTELVIHAQIEDEFLYPALREAFDDAALIDQAEVEHGVARQLIGELESMHPDDNLYDAKFIVLGEYVRHHIQEEQNKIFPKIRESGMNLEALGKDILQRRIDLRNEFGIPDEGYEEDSEGTEFHPRTKWRYPHHH